MSTTRQLTPREVLFVGGESSTVYQHTAGLTLLDASTRPEFGYETLRGFLEERLAEVPHLRWRLHQVPLGLDLPYWVEDEAFSFDHHIRRIAVPSPADDAALGELVGHLYGRHLDRGRPLWETWFIEGLPDRRFGLLTKLHHSLMDGEGATKLAALMTDRQPDPSGWEMDPAIAGAEAGSHPSPWQVSFNAAAHLAATPLRAGREVVDATRHVLRARADRSTPPAPHTPSTVLNGAIGSQRGFVFGSLSLPDIKAVKTRFGATVNDVVLALVGGSLRGYLLERDALPVESLRTSIAVSLRTADDEDFSNRVTTAGVTLATDVEDPAERLRVIAADSHRATRQARAGTKGILEAVSILPPVLVGALMSVAPADLIPRAAGFNLIVSNLRGSPVPLYMAGARVTAMYPASIITPGGALNVTCISYDDRVDFGFTIEPDVVVEPWRLVDGLHDELRALLVDTTPC